MKPLRILIIVSIAANVALAGWWFKPRNAATKSESANAESASSVGKSGSRFGKKSSETGSAPNETTGSTETGATGEITTWLDIQSADLKQFVRRLREAGCPDETVKDIIVAEVNRIFAARTRELWPERYEQAEFWKVENNRYNSERQKKNRESWRKERQMQKEKSALLVELLGVDPEKQQRIEDGYDEAFNWQERQVSFLPESKREAAQKILDEFQDKQQEMYAANASIHDAQSRAEQKQLEAEKMAALAGILTPAELRDFELRESQTASQLTHDLRGLSISREEYEAIFDTKKKYGDSIYNYGDRSSRDEQKQIEENKKAMNAELAAALGPDKFKEYERGTDYSYQQLTRLAKRNDLPAETAGKVFDYKSTAEDAAKNLRGNKDMTNEQRQTALQQIRAETEETLKKTLGEKAYKSYLRNGGWWINNIAPQQSSGTATRAGNVIIRSP